MAQDGWSEALSIKEDSEPWGRRPGRMIASGRSISGQECLKSEEVEQSKCPRERRERKWCKACRYSAPCWRIREARIGIEQLCLQLLSIASKLLQLGVCVSDTRSYLLCILKYGIMSTLQLVILGSR